VVGEGLAPPENKKLKPIYVGRWIFSYIFVIQKFCILAGGASPSPANTKSGEPKNIPCFFFIFMVK
jgi:hypothetical protein